MLPGRAPTTLRTSHAWSRRSGHWLRNCLSNLAQVPLGMVRQVNDRRGQLGADFLRRFESTAEKDAKLYFNDINSKDARVPARAGYQLGVLVIRELSKEYSIQTMAHWSQAEVKPRVHAALERISAIR